MIKREAEAYLKAIAKKYPVVTITGPRQSGKTTLTKKVFSGKEYINLEFPDVREFAAEDPRGFLRRLPNGAVIDEIQRAPDLVSYIQGIVDEKQSNGMFILTGSQQFEISNKISQSLAGRTALLKLLPFSLSEVKKYTANFEVEDYLYNGFFPRIYDRNLNPTQALGDYFETYIERDLRQLVQIKNLSQFQKFVKLCAGRTGQLLNLNNLAEDVGTSHTTIREWITLLQASYVVFLLEPFHANIKKRLIKSPKLYFYDVGFASYLLGIENESHLQAHPLRGNLFENMVVMEILKFRFNLGKRCNFNFYRDSSGNEVDIIYNVGANHLPIEIKSGETISPLYFKGLKYFENNFPRLPFGQAIIYAGDQNQTRQNVKIRNYKYLNKLLAEISESN